MKKVKAAKSSGTLPTFGAAMTPEARENQMIALAMDVVEQRLRDGTATSQETTHFLKLATAKYQHELKILEKQAELITARTEDIKSSERSEELYKKAIEAVTRYGGNMRHAQE